MAQHNADTLASAVLEYRDILADAKTGKYRVLLFIPETTSTDKFDDLINDECPWPWIRYFTGLQVGPRIWLIYPMFVTMRARSPE